jgi:hypothetical protein
MLGHEMDNYLTRLRLARLRFEGAYKDLSEMEKILKQKIRGPHGRTTDKAKTHIDPTVTYHITHTYKDQDTDPAYEQGNQVPTPIQVSQDSLMQTHSTEQVSNKRLNPSRYEEPSVH